MKTFPVSFRIALGFILFIAAFWLGFAFVVAAGAHPSYSRLASLRWIMVSLALLTSAALAVLFIFLRRQNRLAYLLGLVFLFFIILLTVTDDLGWIDFLFLAVTVIPIVLLLVNRKWYSKTKPGDPALN